MLSTIFLQAIKDEISKDPDNTGYANKTATEIADLLNTPKQIPRTVFDEAPSPIQKIFNKVAYSPTAVTPKDVTDAQPQILIP